MNVSILLPYGIFTESNLQYKKYLDDILIHLNQNKSDVLLLCGGITEHNLSEAQSVENYLKDKVTTKKILKEEKSYTTAGNLYFAKALLEEENIDPTSVTVYCDSIRAPKVFYTTLELFADYLTEEERLSALMTGLTKNDGNTLNRLSYRKDTIAIEGIPLGRSLEEVAKQIGSSIIETGYLKYPSLHERIIEYRKKLLNL
jgi:hypothetical protein